MIDDALRALLGAAPGEPPRDVLALKAPWSLGRTQVSRGLPFLADHSLRARGQSSALTYAIDAHGAIRPARGLGRWFAPGWLISAGSTACAPVLEQVASKVAPGQTTWQLFLSAKDKALLSIDGPAGPQMVRMPLSLAALEAEERAYEALQSLANSGLLGSAVPQPLGEGRCGEQAFFVEQRMPGLPVAAALTESHRAGLAAQAESLLDSLNPGLVNAPLRVVDDVMGQLVRRHVRALANCMQDAGTRRDIESRLLATLLPIRSRQGRLHGDFSASNLLACDGRLSGLIDWEDSLPEAPPVLDVLNYLDSVQRRCHRQTLADTIPSLAHDRWPQDDERRWLDRAYVRSGVTPEDRPAVVMLYFLMHVGPQLAFAGAKATACRHVESVFQSVWGC